MNTSACSQAASVLPTSVRRCPSFSRGAAQRSTPKATLLFGLLAAVFALPRADAKSAASSVATLDVAVSRHVIAGGGRASGGPFVVDGSIGQADAEPLHPATGGAFSLVSGFWAGPRSPRLPTLFRDGFESSVAAQAGGEDRKAIATASPAPLSEDDL